MTPRILAAGLMKAKHGRMSARLRMLRTIHGTDGGVLIANPATSTACRQAVAQPQNGLASRRRYETSDQTPGTGTG